MTTTYTLKMKKSATEILKKKKELLQGHASRQWKARNRTQVSAFLPQALPCPSCSSERLLDGT